VLGPIGTVEHLMSAFAGAGVTDGEVELSYPELPALDGSAAGYVFRTQPPGRGRGRGAGRGARGRGRCAQRPAGQREVDLHLPARPGRTFTCLLPRDYRAEVAPARTFAIADQVPAMAARGLGRGLDETSVVLLRPDGGLTAPRFPDEPARHKLLDLVGDLYLAGIPVGLLDVTAAGAGHTANVAMACLLAGAR
jgi:UDP-3-O-[3-hydroxymyristoyl] N-acetylglucosamine deacetylase